LVASRQAELEQLGNEWREEHSRGLRETMRRLCGEVSGGVGGE